MNGFVLCLVMVFINLLFVYLFDFLLKFMSLMYNSFFIVDVGTI